MRRRRVIALIAALVGALAPAAACAQPADLALCDRVAADPTDPDKPPTVAGVAEVAAADVATAIKFCGSASKGSRRAMYQLGRAYLANRQSSEAIAAFRRAADKGSSAAMVELGVMYANGSGVLADETQARTLLDRASKAGNPRGVANLMALTKNAGAASDPAQARAMLSRAAETNAEAQFQLGMLLADGAGGPQDDAGARGLFEKAAAQGHAGAMERAGAFAAAGRGGPKDSDAAKEFYRKAAALGKEDAKAALKRSECPIMIGNKQGKRVTELCF